MAATSTTASVPIERYILPETYVDRLLSSRYVQHFYTAEERAQIRARWVRA